MRRGITGAGSWKTLTRACPSSREKFLGIGSLGVGAAPTSYPQTRNWVLVLFLQPYEQHGQEPG